MAAVAERRFGDAEALCDTGANVRANGAAYLVGFVIEILLKARLIDKFPSVARKRQHEVQDTEREVWSLIWRRHDLAEMLDHLPELEAALKRRGEITGVNYVRDLKEICASWTIQARYSSNAMLQEEARDLLDRVRRLKEVLK